MKILKITTNTGIVNYDCTSVFYCEKVISNNYIFYRTIESKLNRLYIAFTEKDVISVEEI